MKGTNIARPWWWWLNPWLYIKRRDEALAAEVRRLAGADKPKPPRRAAEIDVRVGANNWDDAVRELKWTVEHVEDHGPSCQSVSGGPSGNHIVTVYQDPTMTHERYFEELDKYLAAAEAAREGRGT